MPVKNSNKSTEESADKPKKAAKSFEDVAKPGNTPALSTSRPVIVGHTQMVKKDPMVRNQPTEEDVPDEQQPPINSHKSAVIEPIEEVESSDQPQESDESEKVEDVSVEQKTEEAKNVENESEEPASPDEAKSEKSDDKKEKDGTVDALISEATSKQEDKKQKDEQAAKELEVEQAIQSKEFYVPVGQVSRRRSNRRILAGLIILLVLVVVLINFAIDSQMLDVGVEPLTDVL